MGEAVLSMDARLIQAELSKINERRRELEEELRQCKTRRDRVLERKIKGDLRVLANRAKHLLFKMGKFRYPEDEPVEYQPGEFMDANIYHWLKE